MVQPCLPSSYAPGVELVPSEGGLLPVAADSLPEAVSPPESVAARLEETEPTSVPTARPTEGRVIAPLPPSRPSPGLETEATASSRPAAGEAEPEADALLPAAERRPQASSPGPLPVAADSPPAAPRRARAAGTRVKPAGPAPPSPTGRRRAEPTAEPEPSDIPARRGRARRSASSQHPTAQKGMAAESPRSRPLPPTSYAGVSTAREVEPGRGSPASGAVEHDSFLPPVLPAEVPAAVPPAPENVARVGLSAVPPRPARWSREEAESPTAGPEIRVTIGRVEVRAGPPASPPPRPSSPAGPRLSLEDYLKKCAGRGR